MKIFSYCSWGMTILHLCKQFVWCELVVFSSKCTEVRLSAGLPRSAGKHTSLSQVLAGLERYREGDRAGIRGSKEDASPPFCLHAIYEILGPDFKKILRFLLRLSQVRSQVYRKFWTYDIVWFILRLSWVNYKKWSSVCNVLLHTCGARQ